MKNNHSDCSDSINLNPILRKYCTPSQKKLLEETKTCVIFKKDQIIFYEDHPVSGVYLIFSGKVKLWKEGIHTHEQIVRFSKDGDLLGYRGCLEDTRYALSATALEDTRVCFIEKDIFFQSLKTNTELHLNILLNYVKNLRRIETRLRDMAEMNVREKVAEALIIAHNAFGTEKDKITLAVQLTRQDIAAVAGISTDQVIKQLSQLKQENIIDTTRKEIKILDLEELKKIIALYGIPETLE